VITKPNHFIIRVQSDFTCTSTTSYLQHCVKLQGSRIEPVENRPVKYILGQWRKNWVAECLVPSSRLKVIGMNHKGH
jgi:hypothetical protein